MRRVQLGGGAVAFEVEGAKDRVDSLDADKLRASGWTEEAITIYRHYRNKADSLRQVAQQRRVRDDIKP